jgi:hypothetical protein
MTTTTEKMGKILHLEAEKYQDRAVLGGLACYADTWLREAGATFGPETGDWVQAVAGQLRAYSSLSNPVARQKAMAALLKTLDPAPHLHSAPQHDEKKAAPAPSAPAGIRPATTPSAPT